VKHLTTDEILLGIRQKNDHILNMIYSEAYPTIEKYILQNRGNEQDAEDVFQEAIVLIYRKVSEDELELTSSFLTYLTSLCKHIWNNQFRKNKSLHYQNISQEIQGDIEKVYESDSKELLVKQLIQKHLLQMAPQCQQLLMLFYDRVPLEEIMLNMGLGSEGYLRKRKYICKKKLMERLLNDPDFRDLFDPE